MSKMIPQETVNALRGFGNISVDIYGIDCTLYVANNWDSVECNDAYFQPSMLTFTEHETLVFIEWSPDSKRLRKLGLYTEQDIPLIAWFKNEFDISIGSYFKVNLQYIPIQYKTDEFEITDVLIKHMHDAEIINAYKAVPRRIN